MSWGITAIAVSATATIANVAIQKKTADDVAEAQEEQAATEQAIAGERSARARRKTMAEAQVARAEQANMAGVGGASKGSAAITSGGNVAAQAAEQVGIINRKQDQATMMSDAAQNVQKAGQSSIGGLLVGQAAGFSQQVAGQAIGKKIS
mgnify:CR=1 FL=1|tara:strand:- start:7526 stop:7975 length:450 start_codon:yes stop_codon:yes gene_type:complete